MKVYIYRQWKRVVACLLALSLILAQPCYALTVEPVEAGFLNDRAANIIGSIPLQASGLVLPGGLTGKGVIVGLADSGLDKGSLSQLPADLQSPSGRIPRVVMLKSFAGREVPDDPIGHGTHMAGTIVGSGELSNGQFKGIAPGASLYFQALLDKDGNIKIPADLEDLFYPAYSAGVRIHVNGWGEESNTYSSHTAQVDSFVYQHPDFLPIFGAGNDGPGQGTLSSEANSKNALVVGSSQTARPVFSPEAVDAGQVAASSSAGPTGDGRIKPDLLAPGSANISLCSALTAGNYEANPAYTRMGGTSMAASVTGGAAALLEEYLKTQKKISRPSSALLKALLINGARPLEGGVSNQSGYGILDLPGTILPLMEGSFVIADAQKDIRQNDCLEYYFQVADPSRPFKATLSWIDPPSASGSPGLVDNLDLELIDPLGRTFLCNDNKARDKADRLNNVEQIIIDKPLTGQYTIRVRGADIKGPVWSTHYGLVFGQALQHEVVSKVNLQENNLYLAGGKCLNLGRYSLKGSQDGNGVYSANAKITPGSDVYISGKNLYLFGESWESGGIQILEQGSETLLVEMNPAVRQGGYYLDLNAKASLMLNGKPLEEAADIPLGAKIMAAVNPRMQTVWSLNASYSVLTGYIERVDWGNRRVKILHDDALYELAPWCALSCQDSLLNSSDADLPYGSLNSSGQDTLAPGVKVSMTISPYDKKVQYLKIERNVVVATISKINNQTGEISTDDGKTYRLFPGSKILFDGKATNLKDFQAGDKISGVLLPDIDQFVELQAYSNLIYGRVVYYNPEEAAVYLFDSTNRFWQLSAPDLSYIISGGMRTGSSFSPGNWVRVVLNQDSNSILRVDLAQEKLVDVSKVLHYYDAGQKMMHMTDGSTYSFTSATQIVKAGYQFSPDLLSRGEKMLLTTLTCPGSSQEYLARCEVIVNSAIEAPRLDASAESLNGVLVIRGSTTANRIIVVRQDGSRELIPVNSDGGFNYLLPWQSSEQMITILAVDTKTGGLAKKIIEVTALPHTQAGAELNGIGAAEPAGMEIPAYQKTGSDPINGTDDLNLTVNRADFISMLGKAVDWQIEQPDPKRYFTDNENIPDQVRDMIYFARQKGFISGYPDGTFRPDDALSRNALVAIMARVYGGGVVKEGESRLPYLDSGTIPSWAESSYQLFHQRGWLDLFDGGAWLEPDRPVARNEAERFIDRIIFDVQKSLKTAR